MTKGIVRGGGGSRRCGVSMIVVVQVCVMTFIVGMISRV